MKEYYHVREIADGVYRITSQEGVFSDLFVGEDQALLWDTGYGYGHLETVVAGLTDKPLSIVCSHGHVDHTCGNGRFNVPVYIHPKDMELCRVHTGTDFRANNIKNAKESLDILMNEVHNILPEDFDEDAYLSLGCGDLRPAGEGHIFELGQKTLRVVEVPGHTAGSIALVFEQEGLLYAGDAMNGFLWLFADEAQPLSVYIHSLRKAKALGMKRLVTSHQPQLLEMDVLDAYLDCALNVDFEKGVPFENLILPGYDARICSRFGFSLKYLGDPYKPAIVIAKDKIDTLS